MTNRWEMWYNFTGRKAETGPAWKFLHFFWKLFQDLKIFSFWCKIFTDNCLWKNSQCSGPKAHICEKIHKFFFRKFLHFLWKFFHNFETWRKFFMKIFSEKCKKEKSRFNLDLQLWKLLLFSQLWMKLFHHQLTFS